MISFENSAFVCLILVNLIGFISCFMSMSNQRLRKKFWKIQKDGTRVIKTKD